MTRRRLRRRDRAAVEALWTLAAQGDVGALDGLGSLPAVADLRPPWRDVLERAGRALAGWTELTEDAARTRIYDAIFDALARAEEALTEDASHPANDPITAEVASLAELDERVFAAAAPALVDRILLALPELVPAWSPFREAIVHLRTTSRSRRAPEEPSDPDEDPPTDPTPRATAIRDALLARWAVAQEARIDAWEAARLEGVLDAFLASLARRREAQLRLRSILGIELEYLGLDGTWGEGVWAPRTWEMLETWAALAETNPAIRRLAEMLGRYEAARFKVEVERVEAPGGPRILGMRRTGADEVVGVHYSDRIDRVTTGELANLVDPTLEILFYMKLLDARLLTYELAGEERREAPTSAVTERVVPRAAEKGPIILCVDTSASMAGEPELVAKTLALAVLQIALRARRPCHVISYSHTNDLRELDLSRFPAALGDLVAFLTMGFRGGTDPVPALEAAIRKLDQAEFDRADVLWITDGRFDVPDAFATFVTAVRERKSFRIHTLLVGAALVPTFVDRAWVWQEGASFADGGVQLVLGLESDAEGSGARD